MRMLLISFFALGIAGCEGCTNYSIRENLFDGKIQYEPKTEIGKQLKAGYEACPECAIDKVQRVVSLFRYIKPALCGAGVVPTCTPDISAIDSTLSAMRTRLAGKSEQVAIINAIQDDFMALSDAERRAVLDAVQNSAGG